MQALQCDICGGSLEMDISGEFAKCESCGTKHSKERIHRKIQEVKINGSIEVEGIQNADKLVMNAKSFMSIGEWSKAEQAFKTITDNYPSDYRGWWGLIECQTKNFSDVLKLDNQCDVWFERAVKFSENHSIRQELENTYNEGRTKKNKIIAKQEQEAVEQAKKEGREKERLKAETIAKNKVELEKIKHQKRKDNFAWLIVLMISAIFFYKFYTKYLHIITVGEFKDMLPCTITLAICSIIIGFVDGIVSRNKSGANSMAMTFIPVIIGISVCIYKWFFVGVSSLSDGDAIASFAENVIVVPLMGLMTGGCAFVIGLLGYIGLLFSHKK